METRKYKSIFSPRVARALLKDGKHKIYDIKADKKNKDKTIFVFEVDDTFIADLQALSKKEEAEKTAE